MLGVTPSGRCSPDQARDMRGLDHVSVRLTTVVAWFLETGVADA